jgi:hypothetical protein
MFRLFERKNWAANNIRNFASGACSMKQYQRYIFFTVTSKAVTTSKKINA